MAQRFVGAVLVAAMGSGCGLAIPIPNCHKFSGPPQDLCIADAGALRITMFLSSADATCAARTDGGTLTLTISGTDCTVPSNNPVVPITNVGCDVSALPAGTYFVPTPGGGPPVTLTLPTGDDAGVRPCP